jgi:hypothetical protein
LVRAPWQLLWVRIMYLQVFSIYNSNQVEWLEFNDRCHSFVQKIQLTGIMKDESSQLMPVLPATTGSAVKEARQHRKL